MDTLNYPLVIQLPLETSGHSVFARMVWCYISRLLFFFVYVRSHFLNRIRRLLMPHALPLDFKSISSQDLCIRQEMFITNLNVLGNRLDP